MYADVTEPVVAADAAAAAAVVVVPDGVGDEVVVAAVVDVARPARDPAPELDVAGSVAVPTLISSNSSSSLVGVNIVQYKQIA